MAEKPGSTQNWLTLDEYSTDFAACAMERFNAGLDRLKTSRRHFRLRRSWMEYNSRDQNSNCDETELNVAGERGELILLRPARYRRLIQDQLSQVMQTPPDFEPLALNTDPESQGASALANGILDHYKRELHLEDLGIERMEYALVLTESFLHLPWDPDAGREIVPEDMGNGKQQMLYEGDFKASVRSPYEVAYDPSSPDKRKPRWWIVREPVNKWDLLEKYGKSSSGKRNKSTDEIAAAIKKAPKWTHYAKEWNFEQNEYEFDDSIAIHYVYGEACASCPEGRRAIVLDDKTVLLDGPLDETRAPVFRLAPSEVIFKPEGHCNNLDGLPIVKAISAQHSTILSNHANYGLIRVLADRKCNIKQHNIGTGLAIVDFDGFDPQNGRPVSPPAVLAMLQSAPELFTYLEILNAEADTIMGGSPVTRGDPKATQGDSGSKAAMLYASAQGVGAGYLRAKLRSDEEVATFIISSLSRHATVPRVISIVGTNNTYEAREFIGSDLKNIPRVQVRQASAARDTFPGRMETIKTISAIPPEQQEKFAKFLYTGKLDNVIEPEAKRALVLDRENQALRNLEKPIPPVRKDQNHLEHYHSHRDDRDSMMVEDPQILARYEQHQQAHIDAITIGSPGYAGDDVLHATGQGPLPPAGGAAPPGGIPGAGQQAQHGPPGGAGPQPGPPSKGTQAMMAGKPPNMPQMPKSAATGEQMSGTPNVGGQM